MSSLDLKTGMDLPSRPELEELLRKIEAALEHCDQIGASGAGVELDAARLRVVEQIRLLD